MDKTSHTDFDREMIEAFGEARKGHREISKDQERHQDHLIHLQMKTQQDQYATYATWQSLGWKLGAAAFHIGAAAVPFSGSEVLSKSAQGLSGIASATGSIGGTVEEKQAGKRARCEHFNARLNQMSELSQQTASRCFQNAQQDTTTLMQMISELHRAKSELMRATSG